MDVTIVAEAPRLMPHRERMRENVARALFIPVDRVSVKATTTERMGYEGRGRRHERHGNREHHKMNGGNAMSIVRDIGLAPEGAKKIEWVRRHMPLFNALEARFLREKPFDGLDLTMSIHLEAKTARAALLFKAGGARVRATGCNPLSTQDDVAAALSEMGVEVFAWHGATPEEYHTHLIEALSSAPSLILDDERRPDPDPLRRAA